MNQEQAIGWLEKEPLFHIDMLESIRRGRAVLLDTENGVLLFDEPAETYMISTWDIGAAKRMLRAVPDDAGLVVGHQRFYEAMAAERCGLPGTMRCYQAAWLHKGELSIPCEGVSFRTLGEEWVPFIEEHYTIPIGEDYILERLKSGVMVGAFLGEEPAGFIGQHVEGSIGMLEVLPSYRGRGIGMALEAEQANRMLRAGCVPYGQIIAGNKISLALQNKLGFSISKETVCWLTGRDEKEGEE